MSKIIKIKCTGTELIDISKFVDLQGNLKELSAKAGGQLKASILKYGFSFPVFCWHSESYFILDAHQRIRILRELIKVGYKFEQQDGKINKLLPTAFIEAESRVEAKKKLLLLNSRYGKITGEGFNEFISEPGFEINKDDIMPLLDLPEIDMSYINEGGEIDVDTFFKDEESVPREKGAIICPKCGAIVK